jgi:hypothetical protein
MADQAPAPTPRTTLVGTIDYLSDRPADNGRLHGREHFTITRMADGRMVQRAHCRIIDPPDVERDSLLAVDAGLRPTDAMVRIETGGHFTGTGWYRFSADEAECEALTAANGRRTHRRTIEPGPLSFCSHALVGDAWMIAAGAPDNDGERRPFELLTSTLNKQGASGPTLAAIPYGVERVGPEPIEVPAGRFETIHYRCGRVDAPALLATADFNYDMWVTADQRRLAVLSMYRGRARYQLTTLDQR